MKSIHQWDAGSEDLFLHAYGKSFSAMGQVKELSFSGLVYEYIDDGLPHPDSVDVDVFSHSQDLYLQKVPSKVVCNVPCSTSNSFSIIPIRRCSLEFQELSDQQTKTLWIYLSREILAHMSRMGEASVQREP